MFLDYLQSRIWGGGCLEAYVKEQEMHGKKLSSGEITLATDKLMPTVSIVLTLHQQKHKFH